jgi:hypothetical protein
MRRTTTDNAGNDDDDDNSKDERWRRQHGSAVFSAWVSRCGLFVFFGANVVRK